MFYPKRQIDRQDVELDQLEARAQNLRRHLSTAQLTDSERTTCTAALRGVEDRRANILTRPHFAAWELEMQS